MKEQNTIKLFEETDALPPLPHGLSADIPVRSKFGFRIVESDGKAHWEAASEADYRASEAMRLGIKPEDVKPQAGCVQTGPQTCSGGACYPGWCILAYNPQGKYYYCTCA